MAIIVIGGFETDIAQKISDLLRTRRHLVHICDDTTDLMHIGGGSKWPVDLLIFEGSIAAPDAPAMIDSISRRYIGENVPPALLFVATAYRGPQFESQLSHGGAHLVYIA
jgi:hypothetical protein